MFGSWSPTAGTGVLVLLCDLGQAYSLGLPVCEMGIGKIFPANPEDGDEIKL